MALIKCKECGTEISKKAKACPKCGAPANKKTSLFSWLAAIFMFVLFIQFLSIPGTTSSNDINTQAKVSSNNSSPEELAIKDKVKNRFQSDQEPTAKDAAWTAGDIFKVAVFDDGTSKDGYASYVCQVLYEYGFKGKNIWAQVIDIVKLTRDGDWVKLGDSRCQ